MNTAAVLYGIDQATGNIYPVFMDAVGTLKTYAYAHAYVGGAWHKNPLVFGYSDVVNINLVQLNAVAGTNTLAAGAVPAGEIWHLQNISAVNTISAVTDIFLYVAEVANNILVQSGARAAGVYALWNGWYTLPPGAIVTAQFTGCTLNDDLYMRAHAVKEYINL